MFLIVSEMGRGYNTSYQWSGPGRPSLGLVVRQKFEVEAMIYADA